MIDKMTGKVKIIVPDSLMSNEKFQWNGYEKREKNGNLIRGK